MIYLFSALRVRVCGGCWVSAHVVRVMWAGAGKRFRRGTSSTGHFDGGGEEKRGLFLRTLASRT